LRLNVLVCELHGKSEDKAMARIDISREVIAAALTIHRKLGPGLLESAYEACLAYELEKAGFRVERQKAVPLVYETVKLDCGFRADLVVDGKLVVALKCKEALHPVDEDPVAFLSAAAEYPHRITDQFPCRAVETRNQADGQ
jgi:GxxExxY protein